MEKLKVKQYTTPEEARNHPSLGLVYDCPRCRVGHCLRHISNTTGKVRCSLCEGQYIKP